MWNTMPDSTHTFGRYTENMQVAFGENFSNLVLFVALLSSCVNLWKGEMQCQQSKYFDLKWVRWKSWWDRVYKAGVRRDKYQYHGWSTRKGGLPINLSTQHHQHQKALETLRKCLEKEMHKFDTFHTTVCYYWQPIYKGCKREVN